MEGDTIDKSVTHWRIEPLRKYTTFEGRSRRQEYWWFWLFTVIVVVVLSTVDAMLIGAERYVEYGAGPFTGLAALAFIIPSIAVGIRHLHDRDKSSWFLLLGLIPLIGSLILLVWYVQRGTVGENRFGPDPVG